MYIVIIRVCLCWSVCTCTRQRMNAQTDKSNLVGIKPKDGRVPASFNQRKAVQLFSSDLVKAYTKFRA